MRAELQNRSHLFKKGQSGNPSGRPKGAVNRGTAITKVLNMNWGKGDKALKRELTEFFGDRNMSKKLIREIMVLVAVMCSIKNRDVKSILAILRHEDGNFSGDISFTLEKAVYNVTPFINVNNSSKEDSTDGKKG